MIRMTLLSALLVASPDPSQEPAAFIEKVWCGEGTSESEKGYWIQVDFRIDGAYNQPCAIVAYFYDARRTPLKDRNREYHTSDGVVASMEEFRPGFPRVRYSKYPLFIPENEFHVDVGKQTLLVRVAVYRIDERRRYRSLALSGFYELPFTPPREETGEITRLEVDYRARNQEKQPGLRLTVDSVVRRLKGKKGRVQVVFYHEPTKPTWVYRHGKESEGVLDFTQEFESKIYEQEVQGIEIWVPDDLFPLKVGRNRFFFKVWLQFQGPDGWTDLDVSRAKDFTISNGDLKLAEVWVLEGVKVLLDWDASEGERRYVQETLLEANRRIYDATDGQIRIRSFRLLRGKSHPDDHADGAIRIYREFRKGDHGRVPDEARPFVDQDRAFASLGTPDAPGDIHLPFEMMVVDGCESYARAVAHEFFHATFGLGDEYEEVQGDDGRMYGLSLCAESEIARSRTNACLMGTYEPLARELCMPGTHAEDASNPRLANGDCYTRVQAAIKKSLRKNLVVPETPVEGPNDPPTPAFKWD